MEALQQRDVFSTIITSKLMENKAFSNNQTNSSSENLLTNSKFLNHLSEINFDGKTKIALLKIILETIRTNDMLNKTNNYTNFMEGNQKFESFNSGAETKFTSLSNFNFDYAMEDIKESKISKTYSSNSSDNDEEDDRVLLGNSLRGQMMKLDVIINNKIRKKTN